VLLTELIYKAKLGDLGFPILSTSEALSIFAGLDVNSNVELLNNTLNLAEKYNYAYRFPTILTPNIVIHSPALAKLVLFDEYDKFDRGGRSWKRARALFGKSSTTCSGASWRRKRDHVQPGLTKPCLGEYVKILKEEIIPNLLIRWESFANSGKYINLTDEIYEIALTISFRCFLGAKLEPNVNELIRKTLSFGNLHLRKSPVIAKYYPSFNTAKFNKNVAKVRKILADTIDEQSRLPASTSILTHLLAKDENTTYPDSRLNKEEVLDEAVFILATGQITVGSTMVWTIIEMLKHPCSEQILINDYKKHININNFTIDSLRHIGKSRNIVKEVLRLYPPIWQTYRVANSDVSHGKYKFTKGAHVTVDILSLSRNPLFWDNPNEFDPSRFYGNYNKHAFIPFGTGPQMCPAALFAPLEITMIIGAMLANYDVELHPTHELYGLLPNFKCSLAAPEHIKIKLNKKR
jgi:cytochrome P450